MTAPSPARPRVAPGDIDPFAVEVMTDPYPYWALIRDTAPAVHLPRHDVWAVGRYADVRAALRDPATFSSSGGIGLIRQEDPVRAGLPSSVDPPAHDRYRRLMGDQLGARHMPRLVDVVRARAERFVDRLLEAGEFDAVADLARPYPVDVLGDLVGLPVQGREGLVRWADAALDTFGPPDERRDAAYGLLAELGDYVVHTASRENVDPEGMAAAVYAAADGGDINEIEAISVLLTFLASGMGTASAALATTIGLLAENPDQYDALRANPALIPGAFEEALRHDAPVQLLFRTAARDADVDGVTVPAGARVMLMFGSANRDERKWPDPDRFDVTRNPVDHLAFGSGPHNCAGQALARLEAKALLVALVGKVGRIEPAGEPDRRHGAVTRGLERLPVRVRPA